MHPNVLLPAATCLLGLAFAGSMLWRFLDVRRRRPHHLVWSLGLLWYALAAGTEALGGELGWTAGLYRTWYLSGAIYVAAYLGAGTVYLHRERAFGWLTIGCLLLGSAPAVFGRHLEVALFCLVAAASLALVVARRPAWFGHAVLAILVVASLLAATRVLQASVDLSLLPAGPDQVVSGQALDAATRALTPPFNISGALVLVLGAIISALHVWRTRAGQNRVASNVLIAVGAFVPSLASGLTRFGITSVFFLGEFLGLVCILAGVLLSGSTSAPPTQRPSASSGPS